MVSILQAIFQMSFLMKTYKFLSKFQWSFFLRAQLATDSSIGLDDGLAPIRRQAIIWINDG